MAIPVKCPGCGKTFRLRDEVAGKRAQCVKCKCVFRIPTTGATAAGKREGGGRKAAPGSLAGPIKTRPAGERAAAKPSRPTRRPTGKRRGARVAAGRPAMAPVSDEHRLQNYSVLVLVLLYYATGGLFTIIWLNLMHGKMPKVRRNDPSALKAIAFLFIPIFSIYWFLFTHLRLCDRINEQRKLRDLPPNVPKMLVVALWASMLLGTALMFCLPFSSSSVLPFAIMGLFLISSIALAPLFAAIVQAKVNELVMHSAEQALEA